MVVLLAVLKSLLLYSYVVSMLLSGTLGAIVELAKRVLLLMVLVLSLTTLNAKIRLAERYLSVSVTFPQY